MKRCHSVSSLTQPPEPDFSYLDALAPYQPLAMKCVYCPIDTRLNFHQVSKLLKEVQVRPAPVTIHTWKTQHSALLLLFAQTTWVIKQNKILKRFSVEVPET